MATSEKRYEILSGLPAYGPLYIPVTQVERPFINPYSEGFVVRFFGPSGESWVANFSLGHSSFHAVFDFPQTNLCLVIAGGNGYIMKPTQTKPVNTFGSAIRAAILTDHDEVVAVEDTHVTIICSTGHIWVSERISWDGIKDLRIDKRVIFGSSYDPMAHHNEWTDFTLDLDTKQLTGGSYRRYFNSDGTPFK
ncbi:hypothetical protein [Larkinella soli]|uniref:hypothetical protein n=1 Tax=Larkinella soli TaxID=1770527 RepID=UPI000FFC876A|nr:hypothetical protein [Larkinella soli]